VAMQGIGGQAVVHLVVIMQRIGGQAVVQLVVVMQGIGGRWWSSWLRQCKELGAGGAAVRCDNAKN